MVQSIIEGFLNEFEDNIIETDPSAELFRSRLVSEADARQVDVFFSYVMDEDNIKHFKSIYGPLTSNIVADVQDDLETRKVLQPIKEPI